MKKLAFGVSFFLFALLNAGMLAFGQSADILSCPGSRLIFEVGSNIIAQCVPMALNGSAGTTDEVLVQGVSGIKRILPMGVLEKIGAYPTYAAIGGNLQYFVAGSFISAPWPVSSPAGGYTRLDPKDPNKQNLIIGFPLLRQALSVQVGNGISIQQSNLTGVDLLHAGCASVVYPGGFPACLDEINGGVFYPLMTQGNGEDFQYGQRALSDPGRVVIRIDAVGNQVYAESFLLGIANSGEIDVLTVNPTGTVTQKTLYSGLYFFPDSTTDTCRADGNGVYCVTIDASTGAQTLQRFSLDGSAAVAIYSPSAGMLISGLSIF